MILTRNRPVQTGKITNNLYALRTGTVNFFIYQDGRTIICIDSGYGKKAILRALDRLGLDPKSITHLLLTHSDFDHVGGLAVFNKAEIFLSSDEEQMVNGQKARFAGCFYNSRIKKPYHLLHDNDIVETGAITIRALFTPGHTAGSISYLVNESVLFVGDTFKLVDGKVHSLRSYINMDTGQQKESIRKLAGLENIDMALTAHWGFTSEFNQAIRECKQTK